MRWFRFYSETLNNPKVQQLPPHVFKTWVNILCIVCSLDNGGKVPPIEDLAYRLRRRINHVRQEVSELVARGLLDQNQTPAKGDLDSSKAVLCVHDWDALQYKSDFSTQRVREHRKRFKTVSRNVTETPPESDSDTERALREPSPAPAEDVVIEQEQGTTIAQPEKAEAPIVGDDYELRLWREGLRTMVELGIKERQARSMIGRWLKDTGDDHRHVYDLIRLAREKHIHDPVAWITAAIKLNSKTKPDPMLEGLRRQYERTFGTDVDVEVAS